MKHILCLQGKKGGGKQGPRYPLFDEFVRWLLCEWRAGKELDMHWTPVVSFCTPCQVRFDVIAKFETLHVSSQFNYFYLFSFHDREKKNLNFSTIVEFNNTNWRTLIFKGYITTKSILEFYRTFIREKSQECEGNAQVK